MCGTFATARVLIGDAATFGISRLNWLKWAMVAFHNMPAPNAQCRRGSIYDHRAFIVGGTGGAATRARVLLLRWTGKLPNPQRRSHTDSDIYQRKPLTKEVCAVHCRTRLCPTA